MRAGPLSGVRVLDLTDERGIYGAKLMADLGADVVRPEPEEGDPLRQRGPFDESTGLSLWHAFFASSRRFVVADPSKASGAGVLQQLLERADVLMTCDGTFAAAAIDLESARLAKPSLVHVAVSSFGSSGPWSGFQAPDLIAGALGGAVAATGTPDTTPLKTFGELNFMVSGTYAAIAALSALHHARTTGEGQRVDVPVHECIVSCLEQVLMLAWYGEKMGRSRVQARQGGTHWSMAFTVMPAQGGAIMTTPMPDFDAQLAWLAEEDAQQDLFDEKYHDPQNLPLYIGRLMQVMREWVAGQNPEELFLKAQARHAPFGWVQPIERLADNPQLQAREWWVPFRLVSREGDKVVNGPGAPYRFAQTPWQYRPPAFLDADTILGDLGWEQSR